MVLFSDALHVVLVAAVVIVILGMLTYIVLMPAGKRSLIR